MHHHAPPAKIAGCISAISRAAYGPFDRIDKMGLRRMAHQLADYCKSGAQGAARRCPACSWHGPPRTQACTHAHVYASHCPSCAVCPREHAAAACNPVYLQLAAKVAGTCRPPPPLAHLFDPEPDELVELIVQLGTVPAVVPLLTLGDVEEMPSAG